MALTAGCVPYSLDSETLPRLGLKGSAFARLRTELMLTEVMLTRLRERAILLTSGREPPKLNENTASERLLLICGKPELHED